MKYCFYFYLAFSSFVLWLLLDSRAMFEDSIRVSLIAIFFLCFLQLIVTGLLWYAERLIEDERYFVIMENWNREPQNGAPKHGKTT